MSSQFMEIICATAPAQGSDCILCPVAHGSPSCPARATESWDGRARLSPEVVLLDSPLFNTEV